MYRFEMFQELERRGLRPTTARLEGGISSGRIPKPPVDSIGVRVYGAEHVDAFCDYLRRPPKPGRRPVRELAAK